MPEHLPQFARTMAAQTGQSLTDLTRLINECDYGDYLFGVLRPRLPAAIASLLDEGVLAVGGLHHPAPDAYVMPVEDRGYAIVLHTGMRDLLYRVTRIIATHAQSGSGEVASTSAP